MSVGNRNVAQEYIKNDELKKEDIKELQRWVESQPHLPKVSEYHLILFLHSCYYKVDSAKSTIEHFYTMKTKWSHILQNRDLNSHSFKKSMQNSAFAKLPQKTADGYQVVFIELVESGLANYVYANELKLLDMKIRLWLEEEGTSPGIIFIMSMKNVSIIHMLKMGLYETKQFMTYVQEGLPIRLKGLHFVNTGTIIEKLLSVLKPFMKKELFDILYIHKDVSGPFFNTFPQECLPKDYGGKAGSLISYRDAMTKQLLDATEFFQTDDKQMADESKRVKQNECDQTRAWYRRMF